MELESKIMSRYGKQTIDEIINERLVTEKTPKEIWTDDFNCDKLHLTSLEGAPHEVHGSFHCDGNDLTSLKGSPAIVGIQFSCEKNNKLISLEGAPTKVGGSFFCRNNQSLTFLKDVHKYVKEIGKTFFVYGCPIKSHVLGILMIKGCSSFEKQVQDIINKYLRSPFGHRRIVECQIEMLNNSELKAFAQL